MGQSDLGKPFVLPSLGLIGRRDPDWQADRAGTQLGSTVYALVEPVFLPIPVAKLQLENRAIRSDWRADKGSQTGTWAPGMIVPTGWTNVCN